MALPTENNVFTVIFQASLILEMFENAGSRSQAETLLKHTYTEHTVCCFSDHSGIHFSVIVSMMFYTDPYVPSLAMWSCLHSQTKGHLAGM